MFDILDRVSIHLCLTMFNMHGAQMEVVLRKFGNSTVVVMPPAVLKDLNIKAGQVMTLDTTPDNRVVLAPKRKFSLSELMAQCDLKAAPPADLALWDGARPQGQEVW